MTCIVKDDSIKTKKALREAVNNGKPVRIEDPSIFNPFTGMLDTYVCIRGECVVTNHPRRSWFARVIRRDGHLIVE